MSLRIPLAICAGAGLLVHAFDQPPAAPALFAPGIISTGDYESHPAFTPDGRTLYFVKSSPDFHHWTIFVSRFERGRWREPEVAPFSGQYRDADPFLSPDGSKLFFISDRPVPGKAHRDLDIWVMDRRGDRWSLPKNLGAPINTESPEWYPTTAADGTLYFGSGRPGGKGRTDLWRARLVNGAYAEPENLGEPVNSALDEYEPAIAPDQSFLLFMGTNRDGRQDFDLFVSTRGAGGWSTPRGLPNAINSAANELSPLISPDGKYFLWSSARRIETAPDRPLTTREALGRLRSAGNGLGDLYRIEVGALQLNRP